MKNDWLILLPGLFLSWRLPAAEVCGLSEVADVFHAPLVQACDLSCRTPTKIRAHFRLCKPIGRIRIEWQIGELEPLAWPPEWNGDPKGFESECKFSGKSTEATCEVELTGLKEGDLVVYRAMAYPKSGRERLVEPVAFAVQGSRQPFITIPVWWHCDSMLRDRTNLYFIPDAEYLSLGYGRFTHAANRLFQKTFLALDPNSPRFAEVFRDRREDVNLWLSGQYGSVSTGDGSLCSFSTGENIGARVAAANCGARVLVHERSGLSDCALIAWSDVDHEGTVFADPPGSDGRESSWRFAHEAGHFLFGQSDEYCCNGGYLPFELRQDGIGNVFLHGRNCRQGHYQRSCDKIQGSSSNPLLWRAGATDDLPETLALRAPPGEDLDSVFDREEIDENFGIPESHGGDWREIGNRAIAGGESVVSKGSAPVYQRGGAPGLELCRELGDRGEVLERDWASKFALEVTYEMKEGVAEPLRGDEAGREGVAIRGLTILGFGFAGDVKGFAIENYILPDGAVLGQAAERMPGWARSALAARVQALWVALGAEVSHRVYAAEGRGLYRPRWAKFLVPCELRGEEDMCGAVASLLQIAHAGNCPGGWTQEACAQIEGALGLLGRRISGVP